VNLTASRLLPIQAGQHRKELYGMEERRQGPGDIPTHERMRDIGSAMVSSMGKKMSAIARPSRQARSIA
jgi:hypothetical protein